MKYVLWRKKGGGKKGSIELSGNTDVHFNKTDVVFKSSHLEFSNPELFSLFLCVSKNTLATPMPSPAIQV